MSVDSSWLIAQEKKFAASKAPFEKSSLDLEMKVESLVLEMKEAMENCHDFISSMAAHGKEEQDAHDEGRREWHEELHWKK